MKRQACETSKTRINFWGEKLGRKGTGPGCFSSCLVLCFPLPRLRCLRTIRVREGAETLELCRSSGNSLSLPLSIAFLVTCSWPAYREFSGNATLRASNGLDLLEIEMHWSRGFAEGGGTVTTSFRRWTSSDAVQGSWSCATWLE